MIYMTGDCHADFSKFSMDKFPEQREMTRDDYVIVCGDFGIWHDGEAERERLRWLAHRKFTIIFVDGNHENFDRLYSDEFPIVNFHGAKAHRIRKNIYHIMRGEVFTLEGKKFFAFGGASSHDIQDGIMDTDKFLNPEYGKTMHQLLTSKDHMDEIELSRIYEAIHDEEFKWYYQGKTMYRVKHFSWWPEEVASEEEMIHGCDTLQANDWKVDYVISHCCPQHVASHLSRGYYKPEPMTEYFDKIAEELDFTRWYFGHYHTNKDLLDKYTVLYERIERIV